MTGFPFLIHVENMFTMPEQREMRKPLDTYLPFVRLVIRCALAAGAEGF
jgi:hypothetical protein